MKYNNVQVQSSFDKILNRAGDISKYSVLDIFAREGDWQSYRLVGRVKSIEAWEIEEMYIPKLKLNLPEAKILCHDSISFINKGSYKKFDLLIIDNSLNCYGPNREYCEHFDFFHNLNNIIGSGSFVIFNVVKKPFNYSAFPDWIDRRNSFYGRDDCSELSMEFIEYFYKNLFQNLGFSVIEFYSECREYFQGDDYLYYIGIRLS